MNPRTNHPGIQALAVGLGLTLLFASGPFWASKGLQFQMASLMVLIVFALSFNLVNLAGSTSFGHAAFFATGAYVTGFLLQRFPEIPFLASLALGGTGGTLVACVIGSVALRRANGIYFAILTLALAQLLFVIISTVPGLGRQDGLTGIVRPVMDLGVVSIDLARGNNLYYFIVISVAILTSILWLIWHSEFGRTLSIIRQDSERTRFLGVNVFRVRFLAFALSGAGSALAGGLYAPLTQLLTPDLAHWSFSGLPLLYCLLGGRSYFWGPVVGTIVFVGIGYETKDLIGLSEIISSVALLAIVLGFPGGLLGGLHKLVRRGRAS